MPKNRRKKLPKDPVTANIQSISHEGRGIVQIDGKTTFIQGALPGENVKFIYTSQRGKFDEGQVNEVLATSNERTEPKCPHYAMCGGCSLQHWQHSAQVQHKQQVLKEHFQHFAQIAPEQWLNPIIGPSWHYRHKARLGVRDVPGKGDVLIGFRERNGRYLTDMHSCATLHKSVGKKIDTLRQFVSQLEAKRDIPQIEIAVGDEKTALIFRHLKILHKNDLAKLKQFAEQENFEIYLQAKGPDSIKKFYPNDNNLRLKMQLPAHNIELLFHPADFTQINIEVNQQMIAQALELLDLQNTDRVLDLFCGIGNLSLPLARHSRHVIGVEGGDMMVERAKANTQHNHINNAEFYAADLSQTIDTFSWAQQTYDKVLLDPPRSGALEIAQQIKRFQAKKIVYIACNPATLARDTAEIIRQGYQLKKAGIMDMFPHTTHVESMALFELK